MAVPDPEDVRAVLRAAEIAGTLRVPRIPDEAQTSSEVRRALETQGFPGTPTEPRGSGQTGTIHRVDENVTIRVMDGTDNRPPRVVFDSTENPNQRIDPATGRPFVGNVLRDEQQSRSHITLRPEGR